MNKIMDRVDQSVNGHWGALALAGLVIFLLMGLLPNGSLPVAIAGLLVTAIAGVVWAVRFSRRD